MIRARVLIYVMPFLIFGCRSSPKADDAEGTLQIAVSRDGKLVAGITRPGRVTVWDLATKKVVLDRLPAALGDLGIRPASHFVTFLGRESSVVMECGAGKICIRSIGSSEPSEIFEGDVQDHVLEGITSEDGTRLAFGTSKGEVFTLDRESGATKVLKPKDIWSVGIPLPIATLEGTSDLGWILSATQDVTGAVSFLKRPSTQPHWEEGYLDFYENLGTRTNHSREPLWRGLTRWAWNNGEGKVFGEELGDVVHVAISPNASKVAACQEGGDAYLYEVSTLSVLSRIDRGAVRGCDSIQFLDLEGRYVAIVSGLYGEASVVDVTKSQDAIVRPVYLGSLRNRGTVGSRVAASFPGRRWLFVGKSDRGIDWYELASGSTTSMKWIGTLE